MSKYTPGPWLTDGRSVFAMKQKQICEVPAKGIRSGKVDVANARLIAAAPELFEALVMMRDADEDCKRDGLPTIPPLARSKIDAAITKAEGGAA